MYFLEMISGNYCQQGHVTALLHCPNLFCKISSHFKVSEALRHQVVQMNSGWQSLSANGGDVCRYKSVISRVLKLHNDTNSFNSTKKAGRLRKTSPREDRMIKRLSMVDRFETAAGISWQIRANLGNEVSSHAFSLRLSLVELKSCSPAI